MIRTSRSDRGHALERRSRFGDQRSGTIIEHPTCNAGLGVGQGHDLADRCRLFKPTRPRDDEPPGALASPSMVVAKRKIPEQPKKREEGRWKSAPAPALEPPKHAFRTGLESCGLAPADTITVLRALAGGSRLDEIRQEIAAGRLLTKRTAHGRRHVMAAIRRRYLAPPDPLPQVGELYSVVSHLKSSACKNQLLLPYVLMSDRAAFEIINALVIPRRVRAERQLTKTEVLEALSDVFRRHRRKPWSVALCVRWAEGLLSVLRDVGALGRGRDRERLLSDPVRADAFSFHLWGLYASGVRGRALVESRFWRMLLLDQNETRAALAAVVERGWWKVFTLGGADEVRPTQHSLNEWAAHELG